MTLMLKQLLYRLKKVNHFFKTLLFSALPATIYYRFPAQQLKIIAITGTDGKTTSSTMAYHVLHEAGKKVALISTVAAYIGDEAIDTGFHVTTPEPWSLQKLLRKIADQGYEYVVLETTSHGIYQYRTWGVKPTIAALTNITLNEALDYHMTFDNYVKAKVSKLAQADLAIINKDDQTSFAKVKGLLQAHSTKTITYSTTQNYPDIVTNAIYERFPEAYNHSNALMIWSIVKETGVSEKQFAEAVKTFGSVPGRMQTITNTLGINIIVDFAHTPNGLYQAITSLKAKQKANSKLIAVFGCAGLRDPRKRYDMGKIAAEHADMSVFTAEDPRTEDIWTIFRQMTETLTNYHRKIHTIPDRQLAIDFALEHLARKGDTVAIFGKGHEQSLAYGQTEYLWNDFDGVERSLKVLSNT